MKLPNKAWGLEFTLAIGCPLNCHYCPQEKLVKGYVEKFGKEKMQMSFEEFQICLSKLVPNAGIAIGGMVEPFQNRDCAKMIRYAYEQGFSIALDTTLMGMTDEDYELIKDVKFEHFQLHLPDLEGNAKFHITDTYLNLLKKVNENFCVTGYSCHGHVHPEVSDIVNPDIAWFDEMMNRAGNLDYEELEKFERTGEITCCLGTNDITGWSCEVLPNGTVILCCMDYGMEHILGNLIEQDWDEIVAGEEFKKIEKGMFDDGTSILCRKCPAAKERAKYKKGNLLAPNAIRTNRILQEFVAGIRDISAFEEKYGVTKANNVKKILESKHICIFGCGRLFKENYFNSNWSDLLCAEYITDNRILEEGYQGLTVIRPEDLKNIEGVLVIIYVTDSSSIKKQLDEMGIPNHMDIAELYDLFYQVNL